MGQPLTLDEVQVAPEDAAQVIYDLRRKLNTPLGYRNITQPGRDNVRQPIPPPTMRLLRGEQIVTVDMSEAQLLALITDAARTLQQIHACRGATVPENRGSDERS